MARSKKPAKPKAKAKIGRPPEAVPQDLAEKVIEWLWTGESLLAFCRQPGMPKRRTIYDWAAKDAEFGAQFVRAGKARGPMLQEMAQEIADDSSRDYIEVEGKNGEVHTVFNSEHVQRSKLRVDTMMKRAACYNPAECGTKLALGGDKAMDPIQVEALKGPELPRGDAFRSYLGKFFAAAREQGLVMDGDDAG